MKTPTDKVRQDVEALRCFSVADCIDFPSAIHTCMHKAADLIESLAAELKITEAVAAQARGLECERDLLAVELEQVERERDAAVEDLRKVAQAVSVCFCCKRRDEEYVSNDCMDCINSCNWQWRGVKEDSK